MDAPRRSLVLDCGRRAGFTDCGVATLEPSRFTDRVTAWVRGGRHASMGWFARTLDARCDPRRKWTWARSALVGVVSYATRPLDRRELTGAARHVARYARGRDYHEVLRERLAAWGDDLERAWGRGFRRVALVDTSAVLERELAVRAGLGWIGKNTCLIGPRGDSWRFIGVLLVDFELAEPPAPPASDRCGSCRACLDACPTGALPQPFVLDARRCISYWTIEHRGPLPEEAYDALGDWVFGCDVCQEVCPWNGRIEPADDPDFAVGPALEGLTLADLARLDDSAFRARFRRTPLARTKRAGLVRNALVAGHHAGEPGLDAVASERLDDEDAGVRAAARWVVQRTRGRAASEEVT